ncbi:hypothetical protein P3G55_18735 [Leptospira sp. 96542]|nr:hypothetical protein [Leptospira sp. 96542]
MSDAKLVITAESAQAVRAVKTLGESVDVVGNSITGLTRLAGPLATLFSVQAIGSFVKETITLADALGDMSVRTGQSIEQLNGLRWAATLSDTSLEAVASGATQLSKRLVENREEFQALGISTTDQMEALIQLGDVFAGIEDPVRRDTLALKLFGKSGTEMLPLLLQGSDGIRRLVDEGKQFGGVTEENARMAGEFNDKLDELKLRAQGVGLTLGQALLPGLIGVVGQINAGLAATDGLIDAITTLGTINPFRSQAGNIEAYSEELRKLQQQREEYAARGFSTAAFDADIADLTKKLTYLRTLQAQEALKGAEDNQSGAESRRLGLTAPRDQRGTTLLNGLGGGAEPDGLAKLRQQQYAKEKDGIESLMVSQEALAARYREMDEAKAESDLQWQQSLATRLAALQMANATEADIERGKLAQIQIDLQLAHEQGWLTEESYRQMREQAEVEHQARMGSIVAQGTLARQKFVQSSSKAQMQTVLGDILTTTQGVAASNKQLFEINKVAGIANAVVNTYTGVSKTLSAYPYPWNLPMAALHLAAGLAQVKQIKNAKFGDSSSAPSIGGGGATPVVNVGDMSGSNQAQSIEAPGLPQLSAPKTQINITLQGSQFSYEQVVNEIIPLINQAGDNGADIRVNGN